MAKKQKMCSNPPVEFSQKAINLLFPLFPDSNGNLDADDVMTALWSHFGQGGKICFPTKGEKEYNEIYDAVEKLITSGKAAFSPVLPGKPEKPAKKPLPKCFWDIVETHLPRYFDREDVAECNDLNAKLDSGEKMTAKEKARLDELNRMLYKEACATAATID